MITTTTLDTFWKEYAPHAVGLDDVFNRLDAMSGHNVNYPPYNLIKHDSSNFTIEVALAGFKREEIEVSTEQNILRVTSKVEDRNTTRTYLHKGLSKRSFNRSWQLSEDVRVKDVLFTDGLLTIDLEKIIPEHQKRTVYDIMGSSEPQLLNG
jgi:molecular chaperone IbpA